MENNMESMRSYADEIVEKLSDVYENPHTKSVFVGFFPVFQGYSIRDAKKLETPREKSREDFEVTYQTHDVRELAFLSLDRFSSSGKNLSLVLKSEEQPLFDGCNEIAEESQGMIKLKFEGKI